MWRIPTMIFMLLPTGCNDASERTFDSSNPIHCMVSFGIAANGATQVSQPSIADEMAARAAFLAEQNGGVPWIKNISAQAMEIAKKLEAAHDERATIKLLDECVERQNADPKFGARKTKQ